MFRCVGIVNKRQKVLTNVHGSTSHDTCQRYSQTEKKMLNVPMPNLIKEYNSKKGGGGMTFWMPWLDVTKSSFGSRNGGGHYIAGF